MSDHLGRTGSMGGPARIRVAGAMLACSVLLLGGCTDGGDPADRPAAERNSSASPSPSASASATPSASPSPTESFDSPPFPGPEADVVMAKIAGRWGMEVHRQGRYGQGPLEAKRVLPEGFTLWVRMDRDDQGRTHRVECMALNSTSEKVAATLAECADIALDGRSTPRHKEWISARLAVADAPDGPKESVDVLTENGFTMRLVARITGNILTITPAA
ncbi:hypothetical protein OG730_38110 [Streptomyces sp. NBC_01298]|uniref:hypothetical protein n=1 Tax=Streptomyces sp. NBC_01298 TaxID=2903817 RepID=UPI002E13230C|nr:hypothetical protein OG730_38110 [Streptomyces sp. NBC_01298]